MTMTLPRLARRSSAPGQIRGETTWGRREASARRTALAGVLYQVVCALCQMVALGMLIRVQGAERFGLWTTVAALTALLPLALLGQQSALLTRLSGVALTDPAESARVFSASCLIVSAASLLCLALLAAVAPSLPWGQLLNAGTLTQGLATRTVLAGLVVATVSLPLTHAATAFLAHQRGDLVHLANIVGALTALIAVALALGLDAPLWAVGSLILAGPSAAGLWLWGRGCATGLVPRPSLGLIDRATLRGQFGAGLQFLVAEATNAILLRTPELIVARLHGVEQVARFAVTGRLCVLMLALYWVVIVPLWPAVADARARGDRVWILRAARRSLALVLAIWAVGALGISLFGPTFIRLWTGAPELVDRSLLSAALIQSLGQALLAWLTIFLGALSLQRLQMIVMTTAVLVYLVLALVLGAHLGPLGVALAQAAASLLVGLPMIVYMLRTRLRVAAPE
jgi:O-antigen/teichoic acid export membrane protein